MLYLSIATLIRKVKWGNFQSVRENSESVFIQGGKAPVDDCVLEGPGESCRRVCIVSCAGYFKGPEKGNAQGSSGTTRSSH